MTSFGPAAACAETAVGTAGETASRSVAAQTVAAPTATTDAPARDATTGLTIPSRGVHEVPAKLANLTIGVKRRSAINLLTSAIQKERDSGPFPDTPAAILKHA
ncbi:hypothetical protein GCM10023196_087300 [Actinoallomurus vinaceus]|uniref:Uncharacterized protein n=1 Tax=Actinoallomurus vinaceus TaxID=1080074 RepID=A0ABP8UT96_9ACTN